MHATTLDFYTDAAKTPSLGFGCVFGGQWTFGKWNSQFIIEQDPSIEFLELYALCIGIFAWERKLQNMRIVIFCDNEAVVNIVNTGWAQLI